MSLDGDQAAANAGANAALDAVEAAMGGSSPTPTKDSSAQTRASSSSRARSPGAKSKQQSLENWSAANVEKWFKTYKDGKYAAEYAGFAGLDGAALSRLSEAEFLSRSKKGDLLFRVVQKATHEETTTVRSGNKLVAVAPPRSRSKSPGAPAQKHNSTLHLNKEQEAAMKNLQAKSVEKPAEKPATEKPKEEKEAKPAKPKVSTEHTESGSEASPQTTPKAAPVAVKEIVKNQCDVEGCDAMAVQGIYCAHHRIKPPDEDGNTSFSGSFVLGENSAESDKKLHDKLEAIFERFAARETQTMDKGRWVAACENLNLVDNKGVRRLDVELVFNVIKPVKGKPVLQFEHFCRGLSQIALKKYPDKGGRSLRFMVRTDLARA
jgi:hypothetical protein